MPIRSIAPVLRVAAWFVGGTLALGGVALGAAALALSQGWLTPFLERQASAALGAPVRIEGTASLVWAWSPGLRVEGVAIGANGEAARVRSMEAAVRLLPLLRGSVVLARIEADAARIDRAALAAARSDGAPQPEARAEEAETAEAGGLPRIERLRLSDITYFDPEPGFGGPLTIALAQVGGSVGSGSELRLDAEGRLQRAPGAPNGLPLPPLPPDATEALGFARIEAGFDLPLSIRIQPGQGSIVEGGLRLGDLDQLDVVLDRPADRIERASVTGKGVVLGQVLGSFGVLGRPIGQWQLEAKLDRGPEGGQAALVLDGSFDGTRIRFDGQGDQAEPLQRFDGRAELSGDDPSDLLETLGRVPISLPPYNVSAQLRRNGPNLLLEQLQGRIGDSDIAGTIDLDLGASPARSRVDLVSSRLDLDDLGPLIGLPAGSDNDETLSPTQREQARLYAASPRFVPDLPFKVDLWRRLDLDVRFRAEQVNAPNLPLTSLGFVVQVSGGRLVLSPLDGDLAGGSLNIKAEIDGTQPLPRASISLTGDKLRIESFLSAANAGPVALGQLGVRVDLQGEGGDLRSLVADANGRIAMSLTGGAVQQRLVELAGLDIAEFLTLALGDSDKRIPIRCIVADLPIERGTARTRALLFDTADSKIAGQGSIDLGNEQMNLMFRVFPRDFSVLSANMPIRVIGPLRSPTVEPAGFGAEDRVLGWLLAPVDAVLAFVAPGYEDDHPCAGALGAAGRAGAPPAPAPATPPATR